MALPSHMTRIMNDTVIAQPVIEDSMGGFTNDGAAITLSNCYISTRVRQIPGRQRGEVVLSSAKITTTSVNNLSDRGFRYTLPSDGRFSPYEDIEALDVKTVHNGVSPSHEAIFLP